ncbi:MAG: hypothetical protein QXD89_01455 [Candidatus Aenigmatarchaeota archaeon]
MEIISFDYLKKILNGEKTSPNLVKIPDNFYELVEKYIKGKMSLVKERKDEVEIRNIKRVVENIYNLRERKILNFAIMHARIGNRVINLTKEEEDLFNKIVCCLKEKRKIIERLNEIIEGKKEFEKLIVFKEDFPSFVGIDGQVYGPFKKGDIAKIPEENMKILVERGIVEEFLIEK